MARYQIRFIILILLMPCTGALQAANPALPHEFGAKAGRSIGEDFQQDPAIIRQNNGLEADWPKFLVLPATSKTVSDTAVLKKFQWNLVDVLTRYRNFQVVTRQDYERFLWDHDLNPTAAPPDSLLPEMMRELNAVVLALPEISQPDGPGTELSARITFIIPRIEYIQDNYERVSDIFTVENERKSWNLAGKCIKVADEYLEQINLLRKAYSAYYFALSPLVSEKAQKTGLLKRALNNFQELVKQEPQNRFFNFMLAMCLWESGRKSEALDLTNHILIDIDPRYAPAHEMMARHFIAMDSLEAALEHVRLLTEIEPDNYAYNRDLAWCLDKLGQADEARIVYEKMTAIDDSDPNVRYRLAEYHHSAAEKLDGAGDKAGARGQNLAAVEQLKFSLELGLRHDDHGSPTWQTVRGQSLHLLATLYHELNEEDLEVESLRELVSLDPAFPGAYYNLGVYAHRKRQYEQALEYYRLALECADQYQRQDLYFQSGMIELEQFKRYHEAIYAFTAALETDDLYRKSMGLFFRGAAYRDFALQRDFAADRVADIDGLIAAGTLNQARVNQVLDLYTRSIADFREAAEINSGMERTAGQQAKKISGYLDRLNRIKRRIDQKTGVR